MITTTLLALMLLGLGETRHVDGIPKVLGCRYVTEKGGVYDNRGRLTIYDDGYGEIDILVPQGWISIPVSGKQVEDISGDVCVYFKRPVNKKNKRRCIGLEKAGNDPVPDHVTTGCDGRRILSLSARNCPEINTRPYNYV